MRGLSHVLGRQGLHHDCNVGLYAHLALDEIVYEESQLISGREKRLKAQCLMVMVKNDSFVSLLPHGNETWSEGRKKYFRSKSKVLC